MGVSGDPFGKLPLSCFKIAISLGIIVLIMLTINILK